MVNLYFTQRKGGAVKKLACEITNEDGSEASLILPVETDEDPFGEHELAAVLRRMADFLESSENLTDPGVPMSDRPTLSLTN